MRRTFFAAAAVLAAAPCAAQILSASNPQGVLAALRDMGYRATLATAADGSPLIESAASGADFQVHFYECAGASLCKVMLFSAGFDLDGGVALEPINAWNASRLGGQAYRDAEGDPILNYFLTTAGGLTPENFSENVAWWDSLLGQFIHHIDW